MMKRAKHDHPITGCPICTAHVTREHAYKGYLLTPSPFDYAWRISKEGFHIATCDSLGAAMNAVDEIA